MPNHQGLGRTICDSCGYIIPRKSRIEEQKTEIERLRSFVGDEEFRSDYRSVADMRTEIERLRGLLAAEIAQLKALAARFQWQTGPIPANGWYWIKQYACNPNISVELLSCGDTKTLLSFTIVDWAGPLLPPE